MQWFDGLPVLGSFHFKSEGFDELQFSPAFL
jgi:hypothetical protein